MPTYASECEKPDSHLQDHRSIDNDLKDVKRQPWASVCQAQYHCRNGERCHPQVEKDVRPRVHKSIGNPPQDFTASKGIH